MTHNLKNKKPLVFVGVSGGVDSSVSAALLKEEGYDVVGVFIKVWQPDFIECTWREEKRDAMRVCAHLGIPFLFFDFEEEYKRGVADYMIDEYKNGRTPNPDVMCNKEVKFGAFLKKALSMGADFVATGHYAQVEHDKESSTFHVSKDTQKDQTYFLWTLSQEQLKHVLFPIGHLEKKEVRILAEKFNLPTATKKDSQGVCFLGKLDMKDFLKHYIPEDRGAVLNEEGKEIGFHDGAVFYTIGERHGFIITQKTNDDKPYYVVSKDLHHNTITVSQNPKHTKTTHQKITLRNVNWTRKIPEIGKLYKGRARYRQELVDFTILEIGLDRAIINLSKNDPTLANGQSFVMYNHKECLGGGILDF